MPQVRFDVEFKPLLKKIKSNPSPINTPLSKVEKLLPSGSRFIDTRLRTGERFSYKTHAYQLTASSPPSQSVHNSVRENVFLETENERDIRLAKVEIAKKLTLIIAKQRDVFVSLCREYHGMPPKGMKAAAAELQKRGDVETRQKAENLLYLSGLKITQSALIKAPNNLIGSCAYLKPLYKHVCGQLDIKDIADDDEIFTLVAHYLANTKVNPDGVLTRHPKMLLDLKDPQFANRIKQLGKHFFLDLKGLRTARDLEQAREKIKYRSEMADAGLSKIVDLFYMRDLIQYCFAPLVFSSNPAFRSWYVMDNWQEAESFDEASKGCTWVLEYGTDSYDRDTKTFNADNIRRGVNWRETFIDYGIPLYCVPWTPYAIDAIDLGSRGLGVNDLIGHKRKDQLHLWDVQSNSMWEGDLIDKVTEYIFEVVLREKYPELYEDNGKGKLTVQGLQKILTEDKYNLSGEYEAVAPGGLLNSGVKVSDAAKRVYKDYFDWGKGKIKPNAVKGLSSTPAQKEGNKAKFAQNFAYALSESGLGTFRADKYPPIEFSKRDLYIWKAKNLKSWDDFFQKAESICLHINSGYMSIAGENSTTAFEVLLGPINEQTGCFGTTHISPEDIKVVNQRKIKAFVSLVEDLRNIPPEAVSFSDAEISRGHELDHTKLATLITPEREFTKHEGRDPSKVLHKAAAIALQSSHGEASAGVTVLERVLNARHKGAYCLSDRELAVLLRTIRDYVLVDLNMEASDVAQLTKSICNVVDERNTPTYTRDALLSAIDAHPTYVNRTNSLSLLNAVFECTFATLCQHSTRNIEKAIAVFLSGTKKGSAPVIDYSHLEEKPKSPRHPLLINTHHVPVDPIRQMAYSGEDKEKFLQFFLSMQIPKGPKEKEIKRTIHRAQAAIIHARAEEEDLGLVRKVTTLERLLASSYEVSGEKEYVLSEDELKVLFTMAIDLIDKTDIQPEARQAMKSSVSNVISTGSNVREELIKVIKSSPEFYHSTNPLSSLNAVLDHVINYLIDFDNHVIDDLLNEIDERRDVEIY